MATESGRCLTARATHASHRARILGLGLSVGIAIALGACGRLCARCEANDTRYSIVGYAAERDDKIGTAARLALSDGTLTNAEYGRVRALIVAEGDAADAKRKRELIKRYGRAR
jgi:hypothetical protein